MREEHVRKQKIKGSDRMQDFKLFTVEQLCDMVDLFCPSMDDYLYVYDYVGDSYHISPHAIERFSIPDETFSDVVNTLEKFVYEDDYPRLREELLLLAEDERCYHNMEYRWLSREGKPIWINCRGCIVREGKKALYMVGCINEIGAQQKADNVSGLLGGASLDAYLKEIAPTAPSGYILRLGLDDFKEINENHGIEYGDMVLRKTAECISDCLNDGQRLYRIVADEFIVADFSGTDIYDAVATYRTIRQAIDRFVEQTMYEAVFTISGGILQCDDLDELDYSGIMRYTEFALNEAKRQGKNRSYIFKLDDYKKTIRKKEMLYALRTAVNNDMEGFQAYYQPLFKSDDDHSLYGAETLLRFTWGENGMISPAEFIPLLEESGLIIPVGRWGLHEALKACKCIQQCIPNFTISVNLSYIQVMKSNVANDIIAAVTKYELEPAAVIIELTESGMLESDARFTKAWSRLKAHGIQLALDDFGTGYSNFHYLHDLKPDIIKFDRGFTEKAMNHEYVYNILSLMGGMIHNLALKMCMEGIENEEELERIRLLAPDYCQGYFFGRPCPFEEFMERFVQRSITG